MTTTSMPHWLWLGLSFMLTVIWGPPLLRILRHFKIGKMIRVEGPERHFSKTRHAHHGWDHDRRAGDLADRAAECLLLNRHEAPGAFGDGARWV